MALMKIGYQKLIKLSIKLLKTIPKFIHLLIASITSSAYWWNPSRLWKISEYIAEHNIPVLCAIVLMDIGRDHNWEFSKLNTIDDEPVGSISTGT